MQLGSGVAVPVAQASSYSSHWTPNLGTSVCNGCCPKKEKEKKKVLMVLEYKEVENGNNIYPYFHFQVLYIVVFF